MTDSTWIPQDADPDRPSAARMYDYLLGGGHNFAADRALAEQVLRTTPEIRRIALLNRAFLRRLVLFLMSQGIRQFLDLGSGIPTVGNVHEIAQQIDPQCKVMYVDIEGVAVAHSAMLLADNPNAQVMQADVAKPADVLRARTTRQLLDFEQPIGLLAVTVAHYIPPGDEPHAMFDAYRDAVASGSYLGITHVTGDLLTTVDDVANTMRASSNNVFPRGKAEIEQMFGDWELVEPGLVPVSQWRPTSGESVGDPSRDGQYAGVAHKP